MERFLIIEIDYLKNYFRIGGTASQFTSTRRFSFQAASLCPALIGKNAKLDANIQALIQTYLQDYSESNMTLAKLQADAEYQSVLAEAREAAKDTAKEEQKVVCQEALELAL